MVQDFRGWPVSGIFPFVPKTRNSERRGTVSCREIPRLLSARGILPFVIAGNGNETPCTLERISKERLRGHRFGSGIEGSQLYLFEPLAPPPGQAPPHGSEGSRLLIQNNGINGVSQSPIGQPNPAPTRQREASEGTRRFLPANSSMD